MKEATGELSMTVVVIIAVIAIMSILSIFLLPAMRDYISNTWNQMTNDADAASGLGNTIPGQAGGANRPSADG